MVHMPFDSNNYEPSTGGQDVFEDGEYSFQITGSEPAQTSKGGTMLVFTLACLDEGMGGKTTKARLNVVNANPQAVEIAMRDLAAISLVCGVPVWQDTQQLHGRPFRARLAKTTFKNNQGDDAHGNEIKAYFDMQGNPPTKGGAAAGAAPAAPTAPTAPAATAPVATAPVTTAPPATIAAAPPVTTAAAPAPVAAAPAPATTAATAPAVTTPAPAAASTPAATPPWG